MHPAYRGTLGIILGLLNKKYKIDTQMEMPPTSGMEPLWNLRSFGLSTKLIFLATLRNKNSDDKEKKKRKAKSTKGINTAPSP